MKATIEHVQEVTITAETTARGVSIAADEAMLVAVRSVKRAAMDTIKAALRADAAYIAAEKDNKLMRKANKRRDAPRVEENEATKAQRKAELISADLLKTLEKAEDDEYKIKSAIARKLGEVGQMLLPLYREDA
jgi:hypothetical protein